MLSHGLLLTRPTQLDLLNYIDVNSVSCQDDRKSVDGHCLFFKGNLISWGAIKKRVVSRSSV